MCLHSGSWAPSCFLSLPLSLALALALVSGGVMLTSLDAPAKSGDQRTRMEVNECLDTFSFVSEKHVRDVTLIQQKHS